MISRARERIHLEQMGLKANSVYTYLSGTHILHIKPQY